LLDALEQLEPEKYSGNVWRCAWTTRDPLAGGTHGGRWHPPDLFEALYASLELDGALAELHCQLSSQPVFSSARVRIHRLNVLDLYVLRLTEETLKVLGIHHPARPSGDVERSREIGAAAYLLELQGIIVPSVRWNCPNLVVFVDRLDNAEHIEIVESHDVNWPAWHARAHPSGRGSRKKRKTST
jgi:hypothetical protein